MRMRVNDQAAEDQLKREAIDAGLKREAMGNQAQMFAAQQAAVGRQAIPTGAAPEAPDAPRQWGEAVSPKAPELSDDHGNLIKYIQNAGMGRIAEGEKIFGDKYVKAGTTKIDPDGSLSYVSPEGHPVKIPSEIVKHHTMGTAIPAAERPKSAEEVANIKARTALTIKRAEEVGKEKGLTTKDKLRLAREHRRDVDKMEADLNKAMPNLAQAEKDYKSALTLTKGTIWDREGVPTDPRVVAAQAKLDKVKGDIETKRQAVEAFRTKDPLLLDDEVTGDEAAAPGAQAPAVAAPPVAGAAKTPVITYINAEAPAPAGAAPATSAPSAALPAQAPAMRPALYGKGDVDKMGNLRGTTSEDGQVYTPPEVRLGSPDSENRMSINQPMMTSDKGPAIKAYNDVVRELTRVKEISQITGKSNPEYVGGLRKKAQTLLDQINNTGASGEEVFTPVSPAQDLNNNKIDDADEEAMVWAKANMQQKPLKAKSIMNAMKVKYPKILGE